MGRINILNEVSIKQILSIFPINYSDRKIELITEERIDEYIDILMSDYFNEELYNKFNEQFSKEELKSILVHRIRRYDKFSGSAKEYRTIIVDKDTNNIIGTLTVYFHGSGVEIAYFTKKEYQRHGEMYSAIKNLLTQLKSLGLNIGYIDAHVRVENKSSIGLLNKLGFYKYKSLKENGMNLYEYRNSIQNIK